ncbi:MAG: DUF998 domain-containing protein [Chryseolinea sp.]
MRNAIGWLGSMLPVALIVGSFLFGPCDIIQPSISHYYFTNMREVFVGLMCAVGLFLFSYKGHSRLDSMVSNAAGLFAFGVALFPTNAIDGYHCQHEIISFINVPFHSVIHFTCAGLFFFTLSMMSLLLFTKSKETKENQTDEKRTRNVIYKVCGWIMLVSIAIIAISGPVLHVDETSQITFWFETVALLAFGISWLTKGEMLFGDK